MRFPIVNGWMVVPNKVTCRKQLVIWGNDSFSLSGLLKRACLVACFCFYVWYFCEDLYLYFTFENKRPKTKSVSKQVFASRIVFSVFFLSCLSGCGLFCWRVNYDSVEVGMDFRYQHFQKVCIQNQINVLLIAHHADDQVCETSSESRLCLEDSERG